MGKGTSVRTPNKERKSPLDPSNLGTVDGAKRAYRFSKKTQTPEEHEKFASGLAEQHPDVTFERRQEH